jgi:hypothetical protein
MKIAHAIALAACLAVTGSFAQAVPDDGKAATKPAAAKKAPAKKAAPAKKPVAAKAPARKAAPAVTANPNVRIYKAGDPNVPTLRDKDGKAIPTNPDAYDVSSAKK